MLLHYLVPMVSAHLTDTETRFLSTCTSLPNQTRKNIQWNELFMSEALCHYGLQQHTKTRPIAFLEAIATTAPYEAFIVPDIRALFGRYTKVSKLVLYHIINAHRPISILAYMFRLYNCSCRDYLADEFCSSATSANNTVALRWLRDPHTGDGVYPWSQWACAVAAIHGYIAMLERLRDPHIDGGVCPWEYHACWCAARSNQLDTLIWLRNPDTGGGVCPWNKEACLSAARYWDYSAVVAWIEAQPDDD